MIRLKTNCVAGTQLYEDLLDSLESDTAVADRQLSEGIGCAYVSQAMLESFGDEWAELFHGEGLILTNGAKRLRVEGDFHVIENRSGNQS